MIYMEMDHLVDLLKSLCGVINVLELIDVSCNFGIAWVVLLFFEATGIFSNFSFELTAFHFSLIFTLKLNTTHK